MSKNEFKLPKNKAVVFRFIAGPRDGDTSRSTDEPAASDVPGEVAVYWSLTKGGKVGARLPVIPRDAVDTMTSEALMGFDLEVQPPSRAYEVINQQETSTQITVTCEYRDFATGA